MCVDIGQCDEGIILGMYVGVPGTPAWAPPPHPPPPTETKRRGGVLVSGSQPKYPPFGHQGHPWASTVAHVRPQGGGGGSRGCSSLAELRELQQATTAGRNSSGLAPGTRTRQRAKNIVCGSGRVMDRYGRRAPQARYAPPPPHAAVDGSENW